MLSRKEYEKDPDIVLVKLDKILLVVDERIEYVKEDI